AGLELDRAGPGGEDRVILAESGAVSGPELRAALTDDDFAAVHGLTGEHLDPEHLGVGVTTVPRGAKSFLMRHRWPPCYRWTSRLRLPSEFPSSALPSSERPSS